MGNREVRAGDRVLARTAFDDLVERRAVTGPVLGDDFVVVRVCTEDEWQAAQSEGREPRSTPWPVEDVRLAVDATA